MTTTDKIKEEYFKHTRALLRGHPDALHQFEQLWQTGQLREAYLSVDEAVSKFSIVRSPEQQKADESFYWDVVN